MKKFQLTTLAVACSLALTACSGDESGNVFANPSTPLINNSNSNSAYTDAEKAARTDIQSATVAIANVSTAVPTVAGKSEVETASKLSSFADSQAKTDAEVKATAYQTAIAQKQNAIAVALSNANSAKTLADNALTKAQAAQKLANDSQKTAAQTLVADAQKAVNDAQSKVSALTTANTAATEEKTQADVFVNAIKAIQVQTPAPTPPAPNANTIKAFNDAKVISQAANTLAKNTSDTVVLTGLDAIDASAATTAANQGTVADESAKAAAVKATTDYQTAVATKANTITDRLTVANEAKKLADAALAKAKDAQSKTYDDATKAQAQALADGAQKLVEDAQAKIDALTAAQNAVDKEKKLAGELVAKANDLKITSPSQPSQPTYTDISKQIEALQTSGDTLKNTKITTELTNKLPSSIGNVIENAESSKTQADKDAAQTALNDYKAKVDARLAEINENLNKAQALFDDSAAKIKALEDVKEGASEADKKQADELIKSVQANRGTLFAKITQLKGFKDVAEGKSTQIEEWQTAINNIVVNTNPTNPSQPTTPTMSAFGGSNNGEMTQTVDGGVLESKDNNINSTTDLAAATQPKVVNNDVGIPSKYRVQLSDGEVVVLGSNASGGTRFAESSDGSYQHSDELFDNVVIGAVRGTSGINALVVQGAPTVSAQVPTTGKATYTGDALEFKGRISTSSYMRGQESTAKADVDFANKTIDVNIASRDAGPNSVYGGKFSGKITKNTFADENGKLKGGFYGTDAAELAGMYKGTDYAGVFAAKKDGVNTGGDTTPTNPTAPTNPTNPVTPTPSTPVTDKSATYYTTNVAEKKLDVSMPSIDDINKVVIDGVTIELTKSTEKTLQKNEQYWAYTNLSDVFFGAAKAGDKHFLFVQGNPTKDMPTTGTATYTGTVLHYRGDRVFAPKSWDGVSAGQLVGNASHSYHYTIRNNGSESGYFTANADFANKSLELFINSNDTYGYSTQKFENIAINGNVFSGTVQDGDVTNTVNGGFFGEGASQIAGKYERSGRTDDSENGYGVFGGQKTN